MRLLIALCASSLVAACANGGGGQMDPATAAALMQMNAQRQPYQAQAYQMPTQRTTNTNCIWITPTMMNCNSR